MAATNIRPLEDIDIPATAKVFYDAVQVGAANHYDVTQRNAWAPGIPDLKEWRYRLDGQTVFVAERDGVVIGFMSLRSNDDTTGIIDLAFVAPPVMGSGVGRRLHEAIVQAARDQGLTHLTTEASLVARPFFERQGWRFVGKKPVMRGGVPLACNAMELDLS